MAITHTSAIRDALANLIATQAAAGTTNPTPRIQIATTSAFTNILSTLNMSATPFGASSSGTITAATISNDTNAAATGAAAYFRIINRDAVEVYRGTVTATGGGGDMQLSSINITAGDTVSITSCTYTAPT